MTGVWAANAQIFRWKLIKIDIDISIATALVKTNFPEEVVNGHYYKSISCKIKKSVVIGEIWAN